MAINVYDFRCESDFADVKPQGPFLRREQSNLPRNSGPPQRLHGEPTKEEKLKRNPTEKSSRSKKCHHPQNMGPKSSRIMIFSTNVVWDVSRFRSGEALYLTKNKETAWKILCCDESQIQPLDALEDGWHASTLLCCVPRTGQGGQDEFHKNHGHEPKKLCRLHVTPHEFS